MQEKMNLPVIPHMVEGSIIQQRAADGYINATAMCKAAGKLFGQKFSPSCQNYCRQERKSLIYIRYRNNDNGQRDCLNRNRLRAVFYCPLIMLGYGHYNYGEEHAIHPDRS